MCDRLVKELYHHVNIAAEVADSRWRKTCGWYDFLRADRPETDSYVEMGKVAFGYLAIDGNGQWREPMPALSAVLAFLKKHTGVVVTAEDYKRFKAILDAPPPNKQHVDDWFESLYPPNDIP